MSLRSRMQNVRRKISARRRKRFFTNYQSVVSDIQLALQAAATQSTAKYVQEKMRGVQSVTSWQSVHDRAVHCASITDGFVLEFGVFSGKTTNYIAAKKDWFVDGFDSFEGLPEAWRDGYPEAKFKRDSLPDVAENVELHVGWFDVSIPKFLTERAQDKRPISYLHIDCDLYSSTKTIFDNLGHKIVPGTVIVFDEYFNFDGWERGEYQAFQEFIAERKLNYRYITFNHKHQQVALVIT